MDTLWLHTPKEIVFVDRDAEAPGSLAHRVESRRSLECPLPYPVRAASVDSVCGFFTCEFDLSRHASVTFPGNCFFGSHQEMYHEAGCVYVYKRVLHFKGCQGISGVRRVSRSLLLQSSECKVHMGVFSVNLGKRVYTGIGCFMENRVAERFKGIRVVCRMLDDNIVVRLHIKDFCSDDLMQVSGAARPSSGDIIVSGMGSVLFRFSWKKILWTEEGEGEIMRLCEWLADRLRECC